MDFTNTFTVPGPVQTVWEYLLNARDVAPCVPGAEITEEIDPTHFKGALKMKLGPMAMTFNGELEMQPDESSHTITLVARGVGLKGVGNAAGTITAHVSEGPDNATTAVEIHSRVDVTGRVAQFGRGIMQDVAGKQIRQFASCLEEKLRAHSAAT